MFFLTQFFLFETALLQGTFFSLMGWKKCVEVCFPQTLAQTTEYVSMYSYWLISGYFHCLKYNLVVLDCCSWRNKRNYLWNPFNCSLCHKHFYSSENIFTALAQQRTLLKVCKVLEASRIALESEIPPDVSQHLKSFLKWHAEPCWSIFTQ